jgi:hypothetical protein
MAYRIFERQKKGEVTSRDEHIAAIREEWDRIEYGPAESESGRKWIGINAWVEKWGRVCQDVIDKDGWDSKYM